MSQRVPNCDLDDNNNIITTPTKIPLLSSFNFMSHEVPMLGYKVGKPACNKKGQALRQAGTTWDSFKGDTLESIVNQHVAKSHHSGLVTVDALVPCFEKQGMQKVQNSGERLGACCSARVGSGYGFLVGNEDVPTRAGTVARGGVTNDLSLSGAETCARDSSVAFNSLSTGSPENTTSSGKQCTGTTATDDRDSISHRMPQSETREEDYKATRVDRSSESNKRIKTSSAVHNQSERRRRDKINQRMKELQKLVPNSSKTDKASMLDEVIQYMKQLQAQLQMMNWMKMYSSMMLPITVQQQQLKMSMMMAQMGIGMGMNKDMVMNMNNMMNIPIIPPIFQLPPFMPMASCADPLQAAQHKSMMDAYSKMAAMYHQLHQSSDSSSKS